MAIVELQKDDAGTTLSVTIKRDGAALDISDTTTRTIIIRKPSGTVDSHAGSFYTDGSDGIITYSITAGDIDEAGEYTIQGKIITDAGTWYSDIEPFWVRDNLS